MGKKTGPDDVLKVFWDDNEKFATLINWFFYNGKEVVRPEDLFDMDAEAAGELGSWMETRIKRGDVVRLWKTEDNQLILCIENQLGVDYGMVIRELDEQAAFANKQRVRIKKENRKTGKAVGEHFVSGMTEDDRIIGLRILTVYYGEKTWDAPTNFDEIEAKHISLGPKYNPNGITLLSVQDADLSGMDPSIRDLFELLQLREKSTGETFRKDLQQYVMKHDVGLEELKVLAYLTGSKIVWGLYDRMRDAGGKNMRSVVAEWENEWAAQLQPGMAEEIAAEKRRADEAEQQVAEEKQRADEADRRADEAKRRADTMTRRLGEMIIRTKILEGASDAEILQALTIQTAVSETEAAQWLTEFRDGPGTTETV